jgi:hypothetical protein
MGGVDGGQRDAPAGSFDQGYSRVTSFSREHGAEDVARSGAGQASEKETHIEARRASSVFEEVN